MSAALEKKIADVRAQQEAVAKAAANVENYLQTKNLEEASELYLSDGNLRRPESVRLDGDDAKQVLEFAKTLLAKKIV